MSCSCLCLHAACEARSLFGQLCLHLSTTSDTCVHKMSSVEDHPIKVNKEFPNKTEEHPLSINWRGRIESDCCVFMVGLMRNIKPEEEIEDHVIDAFLTDQSVDESLTHIVVITSDDC